MKHVEEFVESQNYNPAVIEALQKAYVNPCLVRRIVTLYEDSKFRLNENCNPYLKETVRYGITETVARILSKYYKFVEEKEEKEFAAYKATHSDLSCFAGTKVLLPYERRVS